MVMLVWNFMYVEVIFTLLMIAELLLMISNGTLCNRSILYQKKRGERERKEEGRGRRET